MGGGLPKSEFPPPPPPLPSLQSLTPPSLPILVAWFLGASSTLHPSLSPHAGGGEKSFFSSVELRVLIWGGFRGKREEEEEEEAP